MASSYDDSARALYPEKSEQVPIRLGPNAELRQSCFRADTCRVRRRRTRQDVSSVSGQGTSKESSAWTCEQLGVESPGSGSGCQGPVLVGHDEAAVSLGVPHVMHVMKCHEGDNHSTRAISLGKSHGVGRRLWAVPCRLPGSGATGAAEGDGIDPESVALDLFRGEIRPLWGISRHLRETARPRKRGEGPYHADTGPLTGIYAKTASDGLGTI